MGLINVGHKPTLLGKYKFINFSMIPIQLRLSGFLSYRKPVELDFTSFELACISGQNGAGKSSLLDAITWSLFGQARKRDESLINLQSETAEVSFTFGYEENVYRVQRSLKRGKGTTLEFQVQNNDSWRPLTERTLRETQARIEQILRLDYDTFVNASFFLQGKADQFTQQTASKRKEVLGSILGLEAWESYRKITADLRRAIEDEVRMIDGRMTEIDAELSEEAQRKARLTELETELKRLVGVRKTQETALESMKKVAATLENQRNMVKTLAATLERSQGNLSGLQTRLADRESERATYADLSKRAAQVEKAYEKWKQARAESERLAEIAVQFREYEARRLPFLEEITVEKARLDQENSALKEQASLVGNLAPAVKELNVHLSATRKSLTETKKFLEEQNTLVNQIQANREKQAELRAENEALKARMLPLDERIKKLESADGASCPVCGQPLDPEHRKATLAQLRSEGKDFGDQHRANRDQMKALTTQLGEFDKKNRSFGSIDNEHLEASNTVTQLTERLESQQEQIADWKSTGEKRLGEIANIFEKEGFAKGARKQLKKVDQELATLGYDAAAHDKTRKSESDQRVAEEEFQNLEKARAALKPIEDEIGNLKPEIDNRKSEIETQKKEHGEANNDLTGAESQAPDLETAYTELLRLQESENQLTQEVGAARQKVDVLKDLKNRISDYATERAEIQKKIAHYKTLERAFGKDGVPALLIEQALPQIEARANELLDRLSNGQMSIRFVTQAVYKDKKREDLKETLEIQISDNLGMRDYEMYSGGEAFRVNFAIRLALSEVLAQRKGARLQTLVIDEGFGSQDLQGRQRLIEAINLVKDDFAKILVITHLDELKDIFPTRIEVEKTDQGSTISIID